MSVQFILGTAGSGKSFVVLNQIKQQLRNDSHQKIILLVPEQSTFKYEYDLATDEVIGGILSVQVLSFQRLAWHIMQEVGGTSKGILSELGKLMILRQEIIKAKDELKLLQGAVRRPGYIKAISQSITEFKRYRFSPEALFDIINEKLAKQSLLGEKMQEITTIYAHYCQRFGVETIDNDDVLNELLLKIPYADSLEDTLIFIDEFHHFLPQEMAVLEALMKKAKNITITLNYPVNHEHEFLKDRVFTQVSETHHQLRKMAYDNNLEILPNILLKENFRHQDAPDLAYLEKMYFKPQAKSVKLAQKQGVFLISGENIASEVDWAAREIRRLCREEGYHFNDIGVLLRNMENYELILQTTFMDYDIPYFLDQKNPLRHHPLLELIIAAFAIIAENFSYQSIFRYLKTDLVPLERDDVDMLENYCLAYGIKGYQWISDKPWGYRRRYTIEEIGSMLEDDVLEKINALRQEIVAPLLRFKERISQEQPAICFIEAILELLLALKVPETLEQWSQERFTEDIYHSNELHKQLWEQIMNLFDQINIISGNDLLSAEDFTSILETGFENIDLGLIPTRLDQVFVGTLHRSRSHQLRAVFLLGVNEGVFPAKIQEEGLFNDLEKSKLEEIGIVLSPRTHERLYDEEFLIYTALTRAKERLYFSYSLCDLDSKGLKPSSIVRRLQALFSNLETQIVSWPPDEKNDNLLPYLVHERKVRGLLGAKLRQNDALENRQLWASVYNYLLVHDQGGQLYQALESLFYTHQARALSKKTVKELYRLPIQLSVSSVEKYQQCPFAHFLSYGLRLQEREIYQLASLDIGQFYHKAMEYIGQYLNEHHLKWRDLSDEQIVTMTDAVLEELAPKLQNEILLSSGRYQYIKRKLGRTLQRSVKVIAEHGRKGFFEAAGVEIDFGRQGQLPELTITLPDGSSLKLAGRIDRVEMANDGENYYVRIIDFKTGTKGLSLTEIFYGLKIQLLTYLEVVMNYLQHQHSSDNYLPAGVFYYFFKNPMLRIAQPLNLEMTEKQIMAEMIPKGLAVADLRALKMADCELAVGKSALLPITLKKNAAAYLNGEKSLDEIEDMADLFDSHSSVVTQEQLSWLRCYVQKVIAQAGEAILSGNIAIRPCRLKDFTSCQYCHYQGICQIENTSQNSRFLLLKDLSKDEVLEKIKKEIDDELDK